MAYPQRDVYDIYPFWKQFFSGQGIEIIKIDPDTHDKLAANSQGITHFIGRSLKEFGAKGTEVQSKIKIERKDLPADERRVLVLG